MFSFFHRTTSYLGIDIGAGGIKVVELANEKGRARLTTYGFTDRSAEAGGQAVDTAEDTSALLGKILAQAKTTTKKCVTGLPIAQVFSATVSVPSGVEKDLRASIELQARKLVPMPLEDMVIDWKVLPALLGTPHPEGAPKTTRVLITGAAKTLIGKYIDIFKRAKLDLLSLETEAFALVRSLVGRDKGGVLVADLGSVRTNLVVISNGIPMISRSLDVGGLAITKIIAGHMGIGIAEAETVKRDLGGSNSEMPKAVADQLQIIANEMRYHLNLYQNQGEGQPVEKILLTGGGSRLPGLAGAIEHMLGIKTFLGDPWARVIYPEPLRPVLDEIGPRFAVAIGLAMRDIE